MGVLRDRFGDFIKVLVDAAVALDLAEVFIQVSPLVIEEFVVDQRLNFDAIVEIDCILCANLDVRRFSRCLKDANCHKIRT